MPKPFQEFGGWLKFFHVFFLGILIVFLYEFVFFAIGLFQVNLRPEILKWIVLLLLYLSLNLIITFWMIRKMENPSLKTPVLIKKLLIAGIIGNILCYALTYNFTQAFSANLFQLFFPVVFYAAAFIYFKNSKRVAAFYSQNQS